MKLSFALTRILSIGLTSARAKDTAKRSNSITLNDPDAPALNFGKCAIPIGPCDEAAFLRNEQCGTDSTCMCESGVLPIMKLCWDCLIAEDAIRNAQNGSGLGYATWGAALNEWVDSCRDAGQGVKLLPGSVVLNHTVVSKTTSQLTSNNASKITSMVTPNRSSSTRSLFSHSTTAGANKTSTTKPPRTISSAMITSLANASPTGIYSQEDTASGAIIVIESTTRTSYVSADIATHTGATSARKKNAASRLIVSFRVNLWMGILIFPLSFWCWAAVLILFVSSVMAIDLESSATDTAGGLSSGFVQAVTREPSDLTARDCLAKYGGGEKTFDKSRLFHEGI